MRVIDFCESGVRFTPEAINQQLNRIVVDPIFRYSEILKNFLTYVVTETLMGHANRLKEYTIAVNVLEKPADFNPQEYGIVRIHAGRLRMALEKYYKERGQGDAIRISIPKGSYVPSFEENSFPLAVRWEVPNKSILIGVTPFRYIHNKGLSNSFADGLGMQLSAALIKVKKFSVIAHYSMSQLLAAGADIDRIREVTGAEFVITGDIQVMKGALRIHVQMIDTGTSQLFWSQMYELKYTADRFFEVQDEMVEQFLGDFGRMAS